MVQPTTKPAPAVCRSSGRDGDVRRAFTVSEEVDGARYGIGVLYNLTGSTHVGAEIARTEIDEVTYVGDDSLGGSAFFSGDFSTSTIGVTVGYRF